MDIQIYQPSICPFCGARAYSPQEEVAHMSERHPDIVHNRLTQAGFSSQRADGTWKDDLADGND